MKNREYQKAEMPQTIDKTGLRDKARIHTNPPRLARKKAFQVGSCHDHQPPRQHSTPTTGPYTLPLVESTQVPPRISTEEHMATTSGRSSDRDVSVSFDVDFSKAASTSRDIIPRRTRQNENTSHAPSGSTGSSRVRPQVLQNTQTKPADVSSKPKTRAVVRDSIRPLGPQHLEYDYSIAYQDFKAAVYEGLGQLGYNPPKGVDRKKRLLAKTEGGACPPVFLGPAVREQLKSIPSVARASKNLDDADHALEEALARGSTWENTPIPPEFCWGHPSLKPVEFMRISSVKEPQEECAKGAGTEYDKGNNKDAKSLKMTLTPSVTNDHVTHSHPSKSLAKQSCECLNSDSHIPMTETRRHFRPSSRPKIATVTRPPHVNAVELVPSPTRNMPTGQISNTVDTLSHPSSPVVSRKRKVEVLPETGTQPLTGREKRRRILPKRFECT